MEKRLLLFCLPRNSGLAVGPGGSSRKRPRNLYHCIVSGQCLWLQSVPVGSFGIGKDGSWDGISFTYYNIFLTNPSYGTLIDGSDLWLETGVGIGVSALSNKVFINPSIGLTHGKLLSDSPRGAVAEGIVPSIAATFNDGRLEGEVFFAYYKALKNKANNSGDYLLYWILPGVRVSTRTI